MENLNSKVEAARIDRTAGTSKFEIFGPQKILWFRTWAKFRVNLSGIAAYSNTASTLDQNMPGQAKLRCTDAAPLVILRCTGSKLYGAGYPVPIIYRSILKVAPISPNPLNSASWFCSRFEYAKHCRLRAVGTADQYIRFTGWWLRTQITGQRRRINLKSCLIDKSWI